MMKLVLSGSSFETGKQLGEFGREAWHGKLTQTALWQTVTAMQNSPQTVAMRELVSQHYPLIWQEIEGLAVGLEADVGAVFAWNCRGDLVPSTSDGCTTVAGFNAEGECLIAHNEDGFPQLREACAWVTVTPDDGLAFSSFAYPGSICGHTFSVNENGIVNTVNNIRAVRRPTGIPRQVLARAALNAATLDDAVTILTSPSRAGAFHHTLAQRADQRIFSVEATGSGHAAAQITGTMGHANHLIQAAMMNVKQVVTASSASRQHRLNAWLADEPAVSPEALAAILSDQQSEPLPIYRLASDDPDDENTLATAVFTIGSDTVSWQIYGLDRHYAAHQGSLK